MSSLILKCIAIIAMAIDHTSIAYFKYTTLFNVLGRLAFPIFAFQISEGYIHTRNLKKYLLRLCLFAIISQFPFILFESLFTTNFSINIFATLLFGLIGIFFHDKILNYSFTITQNPKTNLLITKFLSIIPIIILGIICEKFHFDYGFFGITVIFLFYIFKNDKVGMIISFITACIIKYGISIIINGYHYLYIALALGTISSLIFILLYNGKKGANIKYLLYLFYPMHLCILYFIFK